MSETDNKISDLNDIEKSDERLELNRRSQEDDDDILNQLENEDDIPAHIREARLNEMKMRARELQYAQQNDLYKELSEDEFLGVTTKSRRCVVHFFHADFRRCDIMHTHLQKLSKKYSDVKFAKINVEKAKFFVNKLSIQVLPAVLCFVDGVLKHRIIGFDQLGNSDSFETRKLEKIFWKLKFIKKPDNEDEESGSEDDDEESNRKKRSIFSKNDKNDINYDSDSN